MEGMSSQDGAHDPLIHTPEDYYAALERISQQEAEPPPEQVTQ